jgi:drug/metabolite transporter (DMT)-like permease
VRARRGCGAKEAALEPSVGLLWGTVAPLGCVLVISTGQLLFKLASGHLDFRRPLADPQGLVILAIALALYGAATLVWVAVLRHAPLSRIYPLMALSFVVTPLGGMVFLKEPIPGAYWAGVALILAGLVVISRAQAAG